MNGRSKAKKGQGRPFLRLKVSQLGKVTNRAAETPRCSVEHVFLAQKRDRTLQRRLASLLKNSMMEPTVGMSRELRAVTIFVMRSASSGPVSSLPPTICTQCTCSWFSVWGVKHRNHSQGMSPPVCDESGARAAVSQVLLGFPSAQSFRHSFRRLHQQWGASTAASSQLEGRAHGLSQGPTVYQVLGLWAARGESLHIQKHKNKAREPE